MPWLKLDDGFFDHEKILDRSKDAKLLHLAALTYCAARSPHGVLSPAAVRVCAAKVDIDNKDQAVAELLHANLWETVPPDSPHQPVPSGSYQIHDFNVYNPTPEQAEAQREARREEERRRADAERQRNKRERDRLQGDLESHADSHDSHALRHGESVTESVTCHESCVTDPVTKSVTCHGVSTRGCSRAAAFPSPSPIPISQTPKTSSSRRFEPSLSSRGLEASKTFPEEWRDADSLSPSALLARYREHFGTEGEARLSAWLAAARKPVQSQAAYLRPCILGWLRGDEPDPVAPTTPTLALPPTRSINAAAAAQAEALRAEHGSVAAALAPTRKENP